MRQFIETNAAYIELAGVFLVVVAALWIVGRAIRNRLSSRPRRKQWKPLLLLLVGLTIGTIPPALIQVIPVDLGPYEKVVNGERHVTLTGWDRNDYAVLGSKHDTVVLQMANPDVTDATLANLKGMDQLKELDLNHSQITDEGLGAIKDLPALTTLRLAHTKITDEGFRTALAGKESLKLLDLQGTAVRRETVQEWKAAKTGRRALQ